MSDNPAQELYANFEALAQEIQECTRTLEHIKAEFCDRSVERNSDLSHIEIGAGDKRDAVSKLMLSCAMYDGYIRRQMGRLDIDIFNVKTTFDELLEQYRTVWNGRNEKHQKDLQEAKNEISLEQMKVRALERRRKEHAQHSPEVREKVWAITGGICFYCETKLTRERCPEEPHRCFEVDHIVAKSNGGPDHISNYVPACAACNAAKSNKSYIEFSSSVARRSLKVVGGTDQ